MVDAGYLACEYFLIRVAPDPIRNEHINLGVALFHPEGTFAGVRFNHDFRRAHCLFPQLEENDLRGLEQDILDRLRDRGGREYFLQFAQETLSHGVQVTTPSLVLTKDPEEELDRLFEQYASTPEAAARSASEGSRRVILRHLQHVFAEERVLARLDRNVRAGEWLEEPDAFRFDFHYRPNGVRHLIQALPLEGDEGAVKEFCFTIMRLRARLGELDAASFGEMAPAAAAEAPGPRAVPLALSPRGYHRGLLANAGVRVLDLEDAAEEAARIRHNLRLA